MLSCHQCWYFIVSSDDQSFKRILLRDFSKKCSGLVFTHRIKRCISGCSCSASAVFNWVASSVSVKRAWICRWQIRCRYSVALPPFDFGTRWWASFWESGMMRSQIGQINVCLWEVSIGSESISFWRIFPIIDSMSCSCVLCLNRGSNKFIQ